MCFWGWANFLQTGMYLAGRTGRIANVSAVVSVVTLVLNYTLISRFGIMGAAWATAIGFLSLGIGSYICSQRVLPLRLGMQRTVLGHAMAVGIYLLSLKLTPGSLVAALGAKVVLLCAQMTTSRPVSTWRLATSRHISATRVWFSVGSSKVLA